MMYLTHKPNRTGDQSVPHRTSKWLDCQKTEAPMIAQGRQQFSGFFIRRWRAKKDRPPLRERRSDESFATRPEPR